MDKKDEVREFLIARRASIAPEQAGLPSGSTERRVPGLRRDEVAQLAGVSTDYYTKLERGSAKLNRASDGVLDAIARALCLTDVERDHLYFLARNTPARRSRPVEHAEWLASVRRVVNGMAVPALAYTAGTDIVAANPLGRALFAQVLESDRPNLARYTFLDSRAQTFFVDWPLACSLNAAMLRFHAGRDPLDAQLTALIGELSVRSPQFRYDWAQQDVHEHRSGQKTYCHPEVGELDITFDVLAVPGDPGMSITTYSPAPGSPSAEKIALLASWAGAVGFSADPDGRGERTPPRPPALG